MALNVVNKTNNTQQLYLEYPGQPIERTRQTIETWRANLKWAEQRYTPTRIFLYGTYRDCIIDPHYLDCVRILRSNVLKTEFTIVNESGVENDSAMNFFEKEWFEYFMDQYIDTIFWGHTLFRILKIEEGQIVKYDIIPRENVLPEKHLIKYSIYSQTGQDYEPMLETGLFFEICKDRRDLGLLNTLAPTLLYKKQAQQDWNTFREKVGFPILVLQTNVMDESTRQQITDNFLTKISRNSAAVISDTEKIEFIQATGSDAWQTFDKSIERCNTEISKAILGATDMVDGGYGGSEARARVHSEISDSLMYDVMRSIEHYINQVFIPKFTEMNLLQEGLCFQWVTKQNQSELSDIADTMLKIATIRQSGQFNDEYLEGIFGSEFKENGEPDDE